MPLPADDAQLIQIMDAALADAARRAGQWLACKPGCNQCCHGAFSINALDALRLQTGIEALRAADSSAAEAVEQRARDWIAGHGPAFPGNLETGQLGTSGEYREQFENFADDAPCPALNPATGLCDVYAWRPMTCRIFGPPVRSVDEGGNAGIGHCELCFIGATREEVAACEMPLPDEAEAKLLEDLGPQETVVAFALLK